ncbi:hypothetical protein Tco_0277889 [Tanacetum coccineum]
MKPICCLVNNESFLSILFIIFDPGNHEYTCVSLASELRVARLQVLIQVLIMKIKRLRREETPRIVGDDSARSEPTEVADSNDFKPLLKEKRLKEQTYRDGCQGCVGKELAFRSKKRATTQRRSLGRRPRTTWPGWKDTVNKKGSRDDCGLAQEDQEAVKECYKEYIGMVKICYEGAQKSKQERPGEDVVGNSRGTAWIKEPQAFAKISVEVGDALDGTPRKKSRTARDLVLVWKATWKRQPRRTRGDSKNKT